LTAAAVLVWLVARWRLALEIGLCLVVLAAHVAGKRAGAASQRVWDQVQAAAAVATENDKNRKREIDHERQLSDLRRDYAAKAATEAAGDARTAADLGSGAIRMRLPVRRCSVVATASTAAARADDSATVSELAPKTSAALFALAADGDRYARQLAALQTWARSAVVLCSTNGAAR
jgi:hypothetical protein